MSGFANVRQSACPTSYDIHEVTCRAWEPLPYGQRSTGGVDLGGWVGMGTGLASWTTAGKSSIYKITKIVRALWLAERSVCMRVCKHGCGVKLLGFSRANHVSTNLKKFSSSKLDKFTLFTNSFVHWNMENRYKEGESIFHRLSWHFKRERSVFCKACFCKIRTDYAYKTSWTRFCDW